MNCRSGTYSVIVLTLLSCVLSEASSCHFAVELFPLCLHFKLINICGINHSAFDILFKRLSNDPFKDLLIVITALLSTFCEKNQCLVHIECIIH